MEQNKKIIEIKEVYNKTRELNDRNKYDDYCKLDELYTVFNKTANYNKISENDKKLLDNINFDLLDWKEHVAADDIWCQICKYRSEIEAIEEEIKNLIASNEMVQYWIAEDEKEKNDDDNN